MMIDWTHIGPSVTAAFLGSLVEFIEALTIVLAVGTVRGWRSAMLGTSMGVLLLAALVAFLASTRASYITGTTIGVDGGAVRGLI